jgi:hypothetical protein
VRATSKKTYTVKHKVSRVGAQSFRVVAPKSGSTKTGISPARSIVGWTWLALYDQSYYSSGGVQRGWTGTVNGGTPPRDTFGLYSDDASSGSHGSLLWRPEEQCDRLTAAVGLSDSDGTAAFLRLQAAGPSQDVEAQPSEMTPVDVSLVGAASLSMRRFQLSGGGYVVVESPKAHCKVGRLPIAYD